MRLIHYSTKPIERFDRAREYGAAFLKPAGFWVSVEGPHDWKEWCEAENWGPIECPHLVTLADGARILRVSTLDEIDAFHAEHSIPQPLLSTPAINWGRVAEKYDGIIIAPYQFERRLARDFMWYYGWDCASGCVWNLAAIDDVRPIEEAAKNE